MIAFGLIDDYTEDVIKKYFTKFSNTCAPVAMQTILSNVLYYFEGL